MKRMATCTARTPAWAASTRGSQPAEAYEAAGQFEQALVEVSASLVADAESFELVQPGEGALDHSTHLAQAGTVSDAASRDQRHDAPLPPQAAGLVEVVAPVGIQPSGLAAWVSSQAPDRWDGVEQRQEPGDVVPVAAGERDGERGSVPEREVAREVAAGAGPPAPTGHPEQDQYALRTRCRPRSPSEGTAVQLILKRSAKGQRLSP